VTGVIAARGPLWRDVRVLKWLVQLVVVGLVAALVIWLYGNYLDNAAEQNIPTDLGFLDNPANFQITGNELSTNAPVRDAIYQGLLNTLRISLAGVVAATILGTIIGIARLSKNWIVNKLAAVYVEAVRNIPLALFVVSGLLIVVLGVFPTIQDAWNIGGLMIVSNRGVAVPWFTGSGRGLLIIGAVGGAAAWATAQ
jgi:general L-amino acid transport system permease protein